MHPLDIRNISLIIMPLFTISPSDTIIIIIYLLLAYFLKLLVTLIKIPKSQFYWFCLPLITLDLPFRCP